MPQIQSLKGNSATLCNTKLVHWPLMGGLLHLVQREEETGWGRSPPKPLLAVPNVTAHTVYQSLLFLHNGPLLCGFRPNAHI